MKFTSVGFVGVIVTGQYQTHDRFALQVHVRDSGIGIEAKDLETVFTRFAQIENDLTREHQGTGLGLTIAKEMVEVMGGNMTVMSEIGRGTTFSIQISLPVPASAQAPLVQVAPALPVVSAPVKRVAY